LHMAMWDDPETGLWHNPMSCYRSNGWQEQSSGKIALSVGESPAPNVYFVQWDRDGVRSSIVYWYQLENTILYDRFDLGMARLALRGHATWPPLIKTLIHVEGASDADRERALKFAGAVYQWLNQPSHKTGLKSAASEKPAPAKPEETINSEK